MAVHCVNKSSAEFTALQEQTNINPVILAAKISLWQESNGLDKFPSIEDLSIQDLDTNLVTDLVIKESIVTEELIKKFYSLYEDNSSISNQLLQEFNNKTEDSLTDAERKIDLMKQVLNAEVIIDASIEDSGQLLPANHPLSKKYNKPVIVINPNKLFSDTVFHEFGHLYIDLLKEYDGVLNQAYELLRDTKFYSEIAKEYPELSGIDLDKEVLATAIGLEGDKIFKNDIAKLTLWQKIKAFILNKLKDIFNIQPNALEQLATELLRNKVRLTGSENFNTIITQRSKYKVDSSKTNVQKEVSDLLDKIQDNFTKERIDDENVYKDKEGNIYSNSVTKNLSKYKKRYNNADKGDYEIKFEKDLYNKDNILFQLNSPRLPLALTKALNDFINDKLDTSTDFVKSSDDKNWLDAYNREINKQNNEDELDELANNLIKSTGKDTSFTNNLLNSFDSILKRAQEYQDKYNQAPIVGDIIHNAIENYIKDNTVFPKNIVDEDNKLFNAIKSIVDKGKANGSVFKTEQILYSENRQIPGTADLIEITKSGEVIIYDYKTTNSFKWGKYNKSDESLYFNKGYAHQLLSYGAILNQYGINLTSDPYHIVLAEMSYYNVDNENSTVTVKDVRSKSLSDKNVLSLLNAAKNNIFHEFASSSQLENINIKPEIQSLSDLVSRINNYISIYRKRTQNLAGNLDTSNIKAIENDLRKQKDIENSINEYIAKNNEIIINSYVNNIHEALTLLEAQKEFIGENLSSEYLQSLNYLLQSTEALGDIKKLLEENPDIRFEDKEKLLKTINSTLLVINNNKDYYKDKLKRLAINSFVENSNLMYGLYTEKYKLEAKKSGIRDKKSIEDYVLAQLKANETEIKIKEINYWTKQYEDGFADLRYLEYLIADPGMSKSQFVQLVKNILDKTDLAIRNKMLDVMPDINNWYENLSFGKTGDPKKVWKKFIETKKVKNAETSKTETKLSGAVIPEFISEYRKVFLRYETAIKEQNRVLKKLQGKNNKTQKDLDEIERLKQTIEDLKSERQVKLKEGKRDKEDFMDLTVNPEFQKLSSKEQEDLRFIHKQLLEADERLISYPEKKLVKELEDGSYIFYLPRERMSGIESIYNSNNAINNFKSRFEDFVRPPADEDKINITQEEFTENDKFGTTNLDIYGNEVFTVPVYYRNELEDEDLQSYDIPTLLALNHETTITFQENKLVEADLFVIAESLSSRNNDKILKTDSFINKKIQDTAGKVFQRSDQNLVYQAVKSSIDNRLYKRAYKGIYSKGNYQLIRGAEAVSKYASTLVLAGNFMSALSTFSQGTIYRFIEAQVGEHLTLEDWKAGTKKAWADFPNMLKDTQRFVPESKSNLLIRKFGLETQVRALTNKFVQNNFAKKQLDQATLFSVTSMAETIVTSTLMYSLLNNIKVTNDNGEFINNEGNVVDKKEAMSLDEAYTVVDKKLQLNKFVKYTSFNITEAYNDGVNKDNTIAATEISRYIRSVYADLYGQYNQDMKSVLQRTIWGKLAMSLRGWLPRGVNRRWRGITDVVGKDFMDFDELRDESNIDKRFYSQDQKQFQEGHYTTSIRFLRSIYREMKRNHLSLLTARTNVRNTLTDHEIANLKRTQYEMAIMLSMAALAMLLRVIALNSEGDDEDKEKIYFAAYLAHRIKTELATFINPADMMEMLSNPAASMSVIQRVFEWMWQLMGVSYSKDEGFNWLINDQYEKGTKEDEYKALIKTYGLIPGTIKYEQLKSIMGLNSNNTISDSFTYHIQN